jgi:hypothetical protein
MTKGKLNIPIDHHELSFVSPAVAWGGACPRDTHETFQNNTSIDVYKRRRMHPRQHCTHAGVVETILRHQEKSRRPLEIRPQWGREAPALGRVLHQEGRMMCRICIIQQQRQGAAE